MTGYHAQLMTGGAAFTFTELTEPTGGGGSVTKRAPFGGARGAAARVRGAAILAAAVRSTACCFAFAHAVPERPARAARVPAFDAPRGEQADRRGLAVLRAERAFAETAAEGADAAGERADADERETECSYDAAKESTRLGAARIAEEIAALKETVAGLVRRMDADTRTREAREEELSGPRALETGSSRLFAKRSEGNGEGNGDAIADERGTNANVAETLAGVVRRESFRGRESKRRASRRDRS